MTRTPLILLAFAALVSTAAARAADRDSPAGADDHSRSEVQAATHDAIGNLYDEVTHVQLTRRLSVGEFAQRTRAGDDLMRVLQKQARQLGGPRWVDDQTCQIEVQIPGAAIGQALRRAAAADPRVAPLSPGEVARIVDNWGDRAFTATGVATSRLPGKARAQRNGGGGGGGGNAPHMGLQRDPWWNVPDAAREQAVATAKADAARRSLSSLRPIALTAKSDVGDVLATAGVGDAMQDWFTAQPAARVELLDDNRVEIELAVGPNEAFRKFRTLAIKQPDIAVPALADQKAWERVQDAFATRMATPVGRAVANARRAGNNNGGNNNGGHAGIGAGASNLVGNANGNDVRIDKPLDVPRRAPAWAAKRLEAVGKGDASDRGKLAAARAAETAAEEKLRAMIEDLTLGDASLGKLARTDARVAQAIKHAIARAKVGEADYHRDGSADVTVYTDLSDLWDELRGAD
jgi:hypothetical protein